MKKKTLIMDLRLFDEGGSGSATGGEGTVSATQSEVGNAAQGDGAQKASFDDLLKDEEYKQAYDQRVQGIIKDRLKGAKETETKLNELTAIMDGLAKRYNVEPGQYEAILNKIDADSKAIESEAMKLGINTEQYLASKQTEREVESLRKQLQMRNDIDERQRFAQVIQTQEAEVKALYPEFDLQTEVANDEFARLVKAGIPLKTAYEVVHKDDIITGAMAKTAEEVSKKMSNAIQSGKNRPLENGIKSGAPVSQTISIGNLTPEQMAQIDKLVSRGSKVDFNNPSAELLAIIKK